MAQDRAVTSDARSRMTVLTACVLVATTPVATWFVLGDLSEPVADPDYMVRPPGGGCVVTGAGWRVVTAGVIGANIGGALVMGLGGPLVFALIVAPAVSALAATRGRPGVDLLNAAHDG